MEARAHTLRLQHAARRTGAEGKSSAEGELDFTLGPGDLFGVASVGWAVMGVGPLPGSRIRRGFSITRVDAGSSITNGEDIVYFREFEGPELVTGAIWRFGANRAILKWMWNTTQVDPVFEVEVEVAAIYELKSSTYESREFFGRFVAGRTDR